MMTPRIIDIPKIPDPRGNLSFLQHPGALPFVPERCYWIYDVPAGETRGSHALHTQTELIIAVAGSFDVTLDNCMGQQTFHLDRPFKGLVVPPLTWRTMSNFSSCSVALIISSGIYDPEEYITDKNILEQ